MKYGIKLDHKCPTYCICQGENVSDAKLWDYVWKI